MTTTAHEDQYTVAPEPFRQPYDTVAFLRRNVADLELALKRQTERAEAAEAEMTKARKQKPVRWYVRGNYFHDGDAAILFASMHAVHGAKVEQLYAAPVPVPAPAVSAANPVQWPEDEGDMILVPRGLLGAACSSIDKQRPAPKVLEAMRHYTMNAPQAPAVPELDPMTRLIVSDPKQIKPKKQKPAVPEFCAVEAQLTLAETEMLNAKAWSPGTQAKRHIDFAMTAICYASALLQSAEVKK